MKYKRNGRFEARRVLEWIAWTIWSDKIRADSFLKSLLEYKGNGRFEARRVLGGFPRKLGGVKAKQIPYCIYYWNIREVEDLKPGGFEGILWKIWSGENKANSLL